MNKLEYIGTFFVILLMILSTAGGTAGGGVLIPLAMAFYGFDTKSGIALSNCCVIFAAFINYVIHFKNINPAKGYGVVIDYNYATLMIPALEIGAVVGVIAN